MWTAASVLACALCVLGRSEASMPPIELIDIAPPGVSVGAEAFVGRDTGHDLPDHLVVGVSRTALSSARQCGYSIAMRKLASILAHEEWHVRHGPDEKAAYQHQLITLIRLGLQPGSGVYREVQRVDAARARGAQEEQAWSGCLPASRCLSWRA